MSDVYVNVWMILKGFLTLSHFSFSSFVLLQIEHVVEVCSGSHIRPHRDSSRDRSPRGVGHAIALASLKANRKSSASRLGEDVQSLPGFEE